MSEKVKLPREVATAIEELRKTGFTDFYIIGNAFQMETDGDIGVISRFIANNTDAFDDESEKGYSIIMNALVNGYEVEETTPEYRVARWYKNLQRQIDAGINGDYKEKVIIEQTTISDVLRILGIKIEGVNA